jgi:hypothetical protein
MVDDAAAGAAGSADDAGTAVAGVADEATAGVAGFADEATETFYRSMSQAHYDQLLATGKLPATSETFISPSKAFAANYDGVLVQFNVRGGTTQALQGVGVRDVSKATGEAYGRLPIVSKGWTKGNAYFKREGELVNIGLGRGAGLDIFNANIINFSMIPK